MLEEHSRPAIPDLLRGISTDILALVRNEVALAKAELTHKTTRLGHHAIGMAVAGGLLLAGGLSLLVAVIYGFTALLDLFLPLGVAVWLSPLVIGGVLALVGWSRLKAARSAFSSEGLSLSTTAATLQENRQWLKSRTH
jgi:hypothetical protein